MKLRIVAVVLAAMLIISVFSVAYMAPLDPSRLYYLAINGEYVYDINSKYSPIMYNREAYVSHLVLTNSDLKCTLSYIASKKYLEISCNDKTITFELATKDAHDSTTLYEDVGSFYYESGGDLQFFLPIKFLCEYFDWEYSQLSTDYGTILRVKTPEYMNSKLYLSDKIYRTASNVLEAYNKYVKAFESPSPAVVQPSQSANPEPSVEVEPLIVFLTFEGEPNEYTGMIADMLEKEAMPAAFFVQGEGMYGYSEELRRLSANFVLGVCPFNRYTSNLYESVDSLLSSIEETNSTLDELTFKKSLFIRLPEENRESVTPEMRDALVASGYRMWDWTIDAVSETKLNAILSNLPEPSKGPAVIRLGMNEDTYKLLPSLLSTLKNGVQGAKFTVHKLDMVDRPINMFNDVR